MNLPPPGGQPATLPVRPAPPLPPMPPSRDDDPDWIWTVNLVATAVLTTAVIGVLIAFALGVAEIDEPENHGLGYFLVIVFAVLLIPVLAVLGVSTWLAARRNRAAFVINTVVGLLAFALVFPLVLAAMGVVGLALTTTRRREERRAALGQR